MNNLPKGVTLLLEDLEPVLELARSAVLYSSTPRQRVALETVEAEIRLASGSFEPEDP